MFSTYEAQSEKSFQTAIQEAPFEIRVAVSDHFNADPDPVFHFNADPDPAFHFNADRNPAFHLTADPGPVFHQNDGDLRPTVYINFLKPSINFLT